MSARDQDIFDLLIIGGGINGAGVARDASGRGLRVLLVEAEDLASATSSASSKLIHGGLRYLEHYEFRLVREALAEREVLLSIAPHIIWPLRFVLPHIADLRPAWMIRLGLWLYDHIGGRSSLPGSRAVDLRTSTFGRGLKPELTRGFVYSDCWVDDARLVVLNARDAADRGAVIRVRTELVSARRENGAWRAVLHDHEVGARHEAWARTVINAAGPWARDVLTGSLGCNAPARLRLVKGSHIVVPRQYEGEHALILQNEDRRIVFVIPYEGRYTLIGTTDVEFDGEARGVAITDDETRYLCSAVNRYLVKPVSPSETVWSYAGVRPLYDDGSSSVSEVTRDYVLELDVANGAAPLLTVFGGKITTYRRLAEQALDKLAPYFPGLAPSWTGTVPLPGGDIAGGDFARFADDLGRRTAWLERDQLSGLVRRHGTRAIKILEGARRCEDLGKHFGAGLYAREVAWLRDQEWARTVDDILFRRTKFGLHISAEQRRVLAEHIGR